MFPKKLSLLIGLWLVQTFLITRGDILGQWINPIALLAVTIAFLMIYFYTMTESNKSGYKKLSKNWLIGLSVIAVITMIISFYIAREKYPNPTLISDIIPQIEFQASQWMMGANPYMRLPELAHHPFPVYMPGHWMPFAASIKMELDARIWSLILAVALFTIAAFIYNRKSASKEVFTFIMLLGVICSFYFINSKVDMMASLETLILGYYFLLAYGLMRGNKTLIFIGVLSCLLSRYTFVFWLPLLAWVLYNSGERKFLWWLIGGSAAALLVFYIIPFVIPHPGIFKDGLAYHQSAAVEEWQGYNGISWTMFKGVYFGAYFKKLIPGTFEEKLHVMRYIQAAGLILTLLIALWRWQKTKLEVYDFLLFFLYIFIFEFFIFGALTYLYYYLSLSGIGAVMLYSVYEKGKIKKAPSDGRGLE